MEGQEKRPWMPDARIEPYPNKKGIRAVLRILIRLAFGLITRLEIIGEENIPQEGPLILVGNHFSFIDPVLMIRIVKRPIEFIGGITTPNAPVIVRFIPKMWGILPVYRGSLSRETLATATKWINQGGALGIFPEGGSWAQVLRPPRWGASFLAASTGAVIVPVGIDGLTEVFPMLRRGKLAKVTARIGKPFGPFEGTPRDARDREKLDVFGHLIMKKIAELLPEDQRGFYSDDPSIREAAKGTEIYPWDDVVETG